MAEAGVSPDKKTKVCPALLLLSLAKIRNANGRLMAMNIQDWQATGISTARKFPIHISNPTVFAHISHFVATFRLL